MSRRRRCVSIAFAAAIILVLFRNPIARFAAVKIGSYVLAASLEIDSIEFNLGSICVSGIVVHEPLNSDSSGLAADKTDAQATVDRIAIDLSLLNGIRSGVWADRVVVDEPCLHVRFDRDGTLVSQFPQSESSSSEPSGIIPIGQLSIRDAKLVVHQIGRESFAVSNIGVQADFGDSINLRTLVPEILGGSVDLRTILDAKSLAGTSSIVVQQIKFDTAELQHLPLVPVEINQERITASGSLQITCNHLSGLAPQSLLVSIKGTISEVKSDQLGTIAEGFELRGELRKGELRIDATGNPLDGLAKVELIGQIRPQTATATLRTELYDCDWKRISKAFPQIPPFALAYRSTTDVSLQWDDQTFAFDAKMVGAATNLIFDGVAIADVKADLSTKGTLDTTSSDPLIGSVTGSIASDGVDLNQASKRFGFADLRGKVGVTASFDVDLKQLASPHAHRGNVVLHTNGIAGRGLFLDDVAMQLDIVDGTVRLDSSEIVLRDRLKRQLVHAKATANVPLSLDEIIESQLLVSLTPSDSVPALLGIPTTQLRGALHSELNASCPVQNASVPAAWDAIASLRGRNMNVAGEALEDFDVDPTLHKGEITIPQFALRWRDNICQLAAKGKVGDSISLEGEIKSNAVRIDDLANIVSRFSGTRLRASGSTTIGGQFRITTSPMTFVASGNADVQNARLAGTKLGQAQLRWNADPSSFVFTSSSADLLGGRYQATATARDLDWTKTVVEGQFQGIETSRLVGCSGIAIDSTGTLDGGLQITSIASLESVTGNAWLRSKNVSAQRLPIEIRNATIKVELGAVSVQSEGGLASGRYSATGNTNLARLVEFFESEKVRPIEQIPITFEAKLSDLAVHRVIAAFDLPRDARRLRATVSGECVRTPAMLNGSRLCSLNGSVENVRWDRSPISDRVAVSVAVHSSRVELENLSGHFADGRLSGKASVDFSSTPVGRFDFSANRVNLRRATAPFASADMSGTANVQVSGRIGPVISGRADVSVDHAVMSGLVVREARFPVDWSYSQSSNVARWQCRAGVVGIGGGRVHIASEGNFDRSLSMATSVRLERIDTSKLLQGSSSGAGVIDGTVTLNAKRARDPKNLVGRFDLELSNIKALELPVMDELSSLVRLAPSRPGNGKDGGYVFGRISGGLVHVEELAISQSTVQVIMSGNATIDGRLDFDVTASTESNGPADQLLEMANSPIMMATAAPIALVAKANELLKDRVVHVHVGGTSARPTLRLQPGKQLSQDAVRFFLSSSLGADVAQAVGPQQRPSRR
ncbi:AsmA-like C-terminal region-containing protein [Novipirellula sp. SH528]|uniref:hypothetical protein n=1 Tax=Novipirellula sp. SH528 TaxID=3454466 RepID=UPI003FA068C5